MKIQNPPFRVALSCAALMFFTPAVSLLAQSNRIPLDTLVLNGSATLIRNRIQLTHTYAEAGSAFVATPYTLSPTDSFEVVFLYNALTTFEQTKPADGLAFIAQNTTMGAYYLGLNGSGLGFFTLTSVPAIAATFDYYPNSITGSPALTAAIAVPIGEDLAQVVPEPPVFQQGHDGGVRAVWVDYDNTTKVFSVYYAASKEKPATPILSTTLAQDLSSQFGGLVYFGFSGGTGDFDSIQSIDRKSVV